MGQGFLSVRQGRKSYIHYIVNKYTGFGIVKIVSFKVSPRFKCGSELIIYLRVRGLEEYYRES